MSDQLDINAQTKVGEILDKYPQLEDVFIELSPAFAKLKNPILRKTVARVASLRQVAEMGNVNIGDMVSKLRKAAGLGNSDSNANISDILSTPQPDWLNFNNTICTTFNAIEIIESGNSPMKDILIEAEKLKADFVMKLITPFAPIPIIEILTAKGYLCWYTKEEDKVCTYIKKV